MPTIPKKIHFIWLGGPIPKNYLATIHRLAAFAKKSGFEINLWVDNKKNYEKTALVEEMKIPNLCVRKIDEVFEKMREDKFHQEENRGKKYEELVRREMIGLKNFGAASDLLRYEILRQEGGIYFDTDTIFEIKDDDELKVEESEYGFRVPWRITSARGNIIGGNDIVATTPDHEILRIAIKKIISEYQIADVVQTLYEAVDTKGEFRTMFGAVEPKHEEKKLPTRKKFKESLIDKKRAQESGCDLLVMSSEPTRENIPSSNRRSCYVIYQPTNQAPLALYYVLRDKNKKPIQIDKVNRGFDVLIKSSLFSRFRGHQFQDIPQLTYAEARLIRDLTGDKRPDIKYKPERDVYDENKMELTIIYSGPVVLIDSFRRYCRESDIDIPTERMKFTFESEFGHDDRWEVLGIKAISRSDQTWLKTKSGNVSQRFFYDDSAINYSNSTSSSKPPKKSI